MKTYDSERKELVDWMAQVTNEYFTKARKTDKEGRTGRDSEATREYSEAQREYVLKMRALKKKYGIE